MRLTTSQMWLNSVGGDLRNLRRAGTLKKISRTATVVPGAAAVGRSPLLAPPSQQNRYAIDASLGRETISSFATEAMLGSASPRNPKVAMRNRSASTLNLLVA